MTDPRARPGGHRGGLSLLLIGLVFLASRLAVLPLQQPASDVGIYARYGREFDAAAQAGVSLYEFHVQEVEREAESARAAGVLVAPIEEYKDVEYPPLALLVMRLPALGARQGPDNADARASFEPRYVFAFRAGVAVIDGALFLLLAALLHRLYPWESEPERRQRLVVYVVSTLLLWPLLYDRLDLLLAALILLALALLVGRAHYGWSFAVLALAIHFKVVPVVLAPLWVVGAMPADVPLGPWRARTLGRLAARSVLLLALVVGGFMPFYLTAGEGCLGFLTYHRARPLEIGSVLGSVPLALQFLGHPTRAVYSYGSINLHSPLTATLSALSPWLSAGLLLAATVAVLVHFRRITAAPRTGDPARATLAQLHPSLFISYTLQFLMLFIAANKVFSPQYLLWLAPLVALLPRGRRGLFTGTFLLVCALSTVLVPFLFLIDLIDPAAPPTVPRTIEEPTARLAALLVVRNLLFLGLTAGLAVQLLRRAVTVHRPDG